MKSFPHSIRLRGPWQWRTMAGPPRHGTMTVPGWWRAAGLPDDWGRVELRRRFHWAADFDPAEVVFLVIERCAGRAEVSLNGVPLGTHDLPWDSFRCDVTDSLRWRNELVIALDAPHAEPSAPRREGLMGCAPGAQRRAVGGIGGPVYLSVESRAATIAGAAVDTEWDAGGGRLAFSARIESAQPHPPTDVLAELLLDGQALAEQPLVFAGRRALLQQETTALPIEPWFPAPLGEPRLHELSLALYQAGRLLCERAWSIGFRSIQVHENRVECNGRTAEIRRRAVWPDETFGWAEADPRPGRSSSRARRPVLQGTPSGLNPPEPQHQASERSPSVEVLQVVGHVALEPFYGMCDHTGILLEQDRLAAPPPGPTLTTDFPLALRLRSHPSVVAWLVPQEPAM